MCVLYFVIRIKYNFHLQEIYVHCIFDEIYLDYSPSSATHSMLVFDLSHPRFGDKNKQLIFSNDLP